MSDTPETQEAVERWRQGKINIFDEMARLERERDALLKPAEAVEAFCLAHNHANKVEEAICSLSFQLQAADEHRRLAERLAEAAMFERDQLRMRVAELQNGIVVEPAK